MAAGVSDRRKRVIMNISDEYVENAYLQGREAFISALFHFFQETRAVADELLICASGAGCIGALLLAARFEVDGMRLSVNGRYCRRALSSIRRLAERSAFAIVAPTEITVCPPDDDLAALAAARIARSIPGARITAMGDDAGTGFVKPRSSR